MFDQSAKNHPINLFTVDYGNTNPHVGLFSEQELVQVKPFSDSFSQMQKISAPVIYAHVGSALSLPPACHPRVFHLSTLRKPNAFLDMPVNYADTLGDDRLFQAYWCYRHLVPQYSHVVLIDIGTYMTVDIINEKGLMGGYIFPGPQTFLNSYQKAPKLPRISGNKIPFTVSAATAAQGIDYPHTTANALSEAYKLTYQVLYQHFATITPKDACWQLTGGWSDLHKEQLEQQNQHIHCLHDPHLIHKAMAYIYWQGCKQ